MFATLPQELRDLIFAFWSPLKDVRLRHWQAYKVFDAVFELEINVDSDAYVASCFRKLWRTMSQDVKRVEIHQRIKYHNDALIHR